MHHRKIMKKYPVFFLPVIAALLFSGCSVDSADDGPIYPLEAMHPLGVWWWDTDLILDPRYFNFAVENHVDEIYLARPALIVEDFGPEIKAFIENAKKRGIKVYLLLGSGYITYEDELMQIALIKYKEYQESVPESQRYDGLHLDIEFQGDPAWNVEADRDRLRQEYLDLILRFRAEIPGTIDVDIPFFWFDPVMSYNGEEKPLYEILMDTVDRVFVMSYRDTAASMYETAEKVVECARRKNKPIMLGALTREVPEATNVSYFEEGNRGLYEPLEALKDIVNYPKAGVAIHHIETWYDLRN
jgi:hypothetical protein